MTEKRYAILIASSSYPKEPGLKDLRCPENDVDALDAVLRSPDFGGFTETFVFKNRPSHEVLERIETVLGEAGRHDLVLIYFSGHGKLNPAGQLCLATANTKLRALGSTSIPAGSIKSYFDHSASRKKILLLDCCYSGAVGKDFARGGVDDQLQLVSQGQGTFIMTASTGIEVAVEKEGDKYGLFTKHLVAGIRSGEADKNEDGFVDMQELYEYVHEKVGAEGAQKPMQWGLGVKGSMIIAKSGREAKEQWRQKLRAMLYKLAAQGWLSDGIVSAAVNVISLPDKEMTAKDRECLLLIEQLADERISVGDFVESWVKSCLTPEPPPPPRLKLLLLILVAVSCTVAGAGWYFFRESPPVSVELPKMGRVSVALPTLPSLSQIKLQPLSPLSSPSERTDLPDKTDVIQEQEQVVEEQSATIPVSPAVVPSPKEEPAQPFIIVDHPRKKKVVVNIGQTHTEDTLEQPVVSQPPQEKSFTEPATDGMELVSDPKELQTSSPVIVQAEEGVRGSFAKRGEIPQKDRTVGQYIDHGDGTITDTKTGLMWKRCSEGLSGDNCEDGEVEKYKWDDAVKRFKNVDYAGYGDWRLPTIDELKTLIYCSKGRNKDGDCKDGFERPTINQQAFPKTSWWYWSGSPYAGFSDFAWYVSFNYGYSDSVNRVNFAVRLVRGGQ